MDCCCMASCFLLLFLAFSVFFILRKHCICIILPRFIGQGTVRQSCAHCCHMVIFSSSFILSFLLIIFWKYRGSELYCCHAAIFCLSSLFFLLPPVYSLRILGFWLFLEKRGRGKGGWEADLLEWDFCRYFLLLFYDFLGLADAEFLRFIEKGWEKERKTGSFLLEV